MLKRQTKELLVVAFCVWHMFAVATYMLPDSTSSQMWNSIASTLHSVARPYVFATSQWQKWDIFSPNPQRRVSLYRVEAKMNDRWEPVLRLDAENLPNGTQAKELKVLGRLEDQWSALVPSYLESLCSRMKTARGKYVRLVVSTVVLSNELEALRHVADWQPNVVENVLGQTQCSTSEAL